MCVNLCETSKGGAMLGYVLNSSTAGYASEGPRGLLVRSEGDRDNRITTGVYVESLV